MKSIRIAVPQLDGAIHYCHLVLANDKEPVFDLTNDGKISTNNVSFDILVSDENLDIFYRQNGEPFEFIYSEYPELVYKGFFYVNYKMGVENFSTSKTWMVNAKFTFVERVFESTSDTDRRQDSESGPDEAVPTPQIPG